jgi:WD40 repeat protein
VKVSLKVRCTLIAFILVASGHTTGRNAQTRPPQRTLPDLTDNVNAMKFSPDGRLLAIARGVRDDNRVDLWDTQTGSLRRTIRGFDGPVWSVSFSPDGHTLLTSSSGIHRDKIAEKGPARNGRPFVELKWWDAQTGDFKQRFELRDEDLISITATYSPDGKFLAAIEQRAQMMMMFESRPPSDFGFPSAASRSGRSVKYDSTVKLLDARTGEMVLKLKDGLSSQEAPTFGGSMMSELFSMMFTGQRRPAIFSPDGQFVAGWNASEIKLWASGSGEAVLKLNKFKGRLRGISFSPDGHSVAAAITRSSHNHDQLEVQSEIRVWEVPTGTPKQVIPLRSQVVYGVSFAVNGHQLLIAGLMKGEDRSHPNMELVDLESGSVGSIVSRDEGTLSSIEVSPNGDLMAFQTGASTVRLVDTQGWRVRYTFDASDESKSSSASLRRHLVSVKSVPAVTFLPDGNTVAGEVESGGIRLWDARTGEAKKSLAQDADTGSIAEASSSGSVLAEISGDEVVRVWNVSTGARVDVPSAKGAPVAIAVSGNGQVLGIAYPDQIVLLNVDDPKLQPIAAPIQGKVVCITLSFDGRLLAGATSEGDVQVWNKEAGILQSHFPAGPGISTLRFLPQGDALAIGGKDGRVSLWNLQSGTMIFDSKKHGAIVNAIAFSADGKLMATGSDDRTAIIWEVASGKARRTLKGHDFTVTSLAFSPGNNLLAVGSGNASVVLWDVTTGKLNRVMR